MSIKNPDIKKFKQIVLDDIEKGDCLRACFASMLCVDKIGQIPNFMKDGEDKFALNLNKFLNKQNLSYIEIPIKEITTTSPLGFVIGIGKSPRGDFYHAVVLKVSQSENGLMFEDYHDPHPDNTFLEELEYIAYLVKNIKGVSHPAYSGSYDRIETRNKLKDVMKDAYFNNAVNVTSFNHCHKDKELNMKSLKETNPKSADVIVNGIVEEELNKLQEAIEIADKYSVFLGEDILKLIR